MTVYEKYAYRYQKERWKTKVESARLITNKITNSQHFKKLFDNELNDLL